MSGKYDKIELREQSYDERLFSHGHDSCLEKKI